MSTAHSPRGENGDRFQKPFRGRFKLSLEGANTALLENKKARAIATSRCQHGVVGEQKGKGHCNQCDPPWRGKSAFHYLGPSFA